MTTHAEHDPPHRRFVLVGRVLRPSGRGGFVRVEEMTDAPNRFRAGQRIYLRGEPVTIERSRRHGQARLLKLKGIDTREAAALMAGADLEIPEADLKPLPQGTYYYYHLVGLRVVSTEREALGELTEIIATGSNDIYVVEGPRGQVLIPAIADVVKDVDVAGGVMTVELIPGLL